jgi:hypothetical protein
MRRLFVLLLASSGFAATWKIDAGSSRFGAATYTQGSQVTVTTSGAPTSTQRGFAYFDIFGKLKVSLPPGVSGTCTGATCDIFTTDSTKGASQYGSAGRPANANDALYWVDPVFNTVNSTVGTTSLLANVPSPLPGNGDGFGAAANVSAGLRFQSSASGFIVQARVYKQAQDTSTSVAVNLSDDSGNLLGTTTISYSSSATGWQTANFSPAIAVSANTFYQIWLLSNTGGGYAWRNGFFRNYRLTNGTLSSAATFYANGNGCDPTGAWPQTSDGMSSGSNLLPSAGIIGCVDYATGGTVSTISPPFGGSGGQLGYSQWANLTIEGCQCMIGGVGPGPYGLIDTVVDNSGNQWHHDNGGGYRASTDFYYFRDIFQWQPKYRTGAAGSDGFQYISRQLLEWKHGFRIRVEGTIFQNAWNDGQGSALMMLAGNKDGGAHDILYTNNEFRHGPGVTQGFGQYEEGPPPARDAVTNNLVWDQGPYASSAQSTPGRGWFLQGLGISEDETISHNTILPNYGQVGAFIWTSPRTEPEGVKITDNIFPVDSSTNGIGQDSNWCGGVAFGEATLTSSSCANVRNLTFANNVMFPAAYSVSDPVTIGGPFTMSSTQTQAGIQTAYPNLKNTNYIPASTTPSSYGWFNTPAYPSTSSSFVLGLDARVKSGSLLSPSNAAAYKATDGKNVGADLQAIRDAEGVVEHVGVPTNLISPSGATIVFNAPDSQACPVDYKIYDAADPYTTTGFTRASDGGTGRTRNVGLTGLSSKVAYQYRINCAAWQPTGVLVTK